MKKKLSIPTYIFTLIWTCVEVNIVSGSPAFLFDWKPSVLILKTISQRNIFAVLDKRIENRTQGTTATRIFHRYLHYVSLRDLIVKAERQFTF